MLVGLLVGGVWFAAFALGHVGLFHARVVQKRFQAVVRLFGSAALGAIVSAGVASAAGLAAPTPSPLVVAIALITMACLFVVYMPFYYAIATSQSIGTLIAVEQAPGRGLPVERLSAERASEAMLIARLDSMAANGNLAREGAAYRLTPKGRRIARTFAALQALWRLGPGG